jgi:hypothetical protein
VLCHAAENDVTRFRAHRCEQVGVELGVRGGDRDPAYRHLGGHADGAPVCAAVVGIVAASYSLVDSRIFWPRGAFTMLAFAPGFAVV